MNQQLWTMAGACVAALGAAMYARQRYCRWRATRAASVPSTLAPLAVPSRAEHDGNRNGTDAPREARAPALDHLAPAPEDAVEAMEFAETRIHRACELLPSATGGQQRAPTGDVQRISRESA